MKNKRSKKCECEYQETIKHIDREAVVHNRKCPLSNFNIIIGLGSGRCGTQTFAKMFNLPHQEHEIEDLKSDVAPYYINGVEYINKNSEAKFVCLKRNKEDTVSSFVRNGIMSDSKAGEYYDGYYKRAEVYSDRYENFKIFDMEELNSPARLEKFLGQKAKEVDVVKGLCKYCKDIKKDAITV